MKPIIGIVGRSEFIEPNKVTVSYNDIAKAIILNGGIPIMIMPTNSNIYDNEKFSLSYDDIQKLNKVLDKCDGIICQGGRHFYDFDSKIIEYAYQNDIPFLGICLGMQAISTVFGGEYIDIGNYSHKNVFHNVILKKDSILFSMMKCEKFLVNSRHEHYVPYTNLDVAGYSEDGIIEAVEDKSKKFFIGVQWHPENLCFKDEIQNRIFQSLIEVAELD